MTRYNPKPVIKKEKKAIARLDAAMRKADKLEKKANNPTKK